MKEQERFSKFSLTAEISRYMNISCLTIAKILRESVDGSDNIVAAVNRHNEVLEDIIIPEIFHTLYEVKSTQKSEDVDMVLLREPKDAGYYEFSATDELVITKGHNNFTPQEEAKSFHADTYCFDSKPEKECFLQYISSNKVREIYFTGMFTSNQGDLSVQYYDPESKRLRKYYPDFLALMEDGSYQLIEVKGDNKIDDEVVLAKKAAAEEMAENIKNVIRGIRNIRTEMNVANSRKAQVYIVADDEATCKVLEGSRAAYEHMIYASELFVQMDKTGIEENAVSVVIPKATIYMPLADLVDFEKEKERLTKEKKRLEGELKRVNGMLNNEKFMSKAPESKIYDQSISDYWLEKGNYLNIDYITLGYNIDCKKIEKYVKNIRVTFSVNNVATITGYSGLSPMINSTTVDKDNNDLGMDNKRFYPLSRTYSLGLSVNF